jgi:hypothetical protein
MTLDGKQHTATKEFKGFQKVTQSKILITDNIPENF